MNKKDLCKLLTIHVKEESISNIIYDYALLNIIIEGDTSYKIIKNHTKNESMFVIETNYYDEGCVKGYGWISFDKNTIVKSKDYINKDYIE